MGWIKQAWMGIGAAAVLALAAGCVDGDFETLGDEEPEAIDIMAVQALDVQFEHISWESGTAGGDWRNKLPNQPRTLCECTSNSCREDWVGENLGCDICVAVTCDGSAAQHTCVPC